MKASWIISGLPLLFALPLSYLDDEQAWKHEIIPNELDGLNYDIPWEAPSINDARSPCPFLNTAANHDLIPRSGRGIDTERLYNVLTTVAGLDQSIAEVLVKQVLPISYVNDQGIQVFNLDSLQKHGFIEHDASLSREDSLVGNNTVFNQDVYNGIKYFVKVQNGKEYLSLRNLGYFRKFRHAECKELHPSTFEFGIKAQVAAAGEASLIYLLFRDASNQIRVEWMDLFFEQERLPFELGWKIPNVITRGTVLKITSLMMVYQNL